MHFNAAIYYCLDCSLKKQKLTFGCIIADIGEGLQSC